MPFKVLTAEWCHETNTFSSKPTTLQNFYEQYYLQTEEEIVKQRKGTKSVLGATYEAAEEYGWELVNTVSTSANPTGKVTAEAFETICEQILSKCHNNQFDGVVLHLHGAMVSEQFEDAEGELLHRLRDLVGTEIPIFVTLDLHGNISPAMAKYASLLLAVRTYPHIDFYEIAQRACHLLQRAMQGEIKPYTIISKGPMLRGLDGGKTTLPDHPMKQLIAQGEALENDGKCLIVSICAGFTAADIYDIGPSVTVTIDLLNPHHYLEDGVFGETSSAAAYAQSLGDALYTYIWETRHYQSEHHRSIPEIMHYTHTYLSNHPTKPLVIADVSDNPGSGHYGDATNLLAGILHQQQHTSSSISDVLFYAIYDPAAVLQGQQIGVGNTGNIVLGGKTDITAGGPPLALTGKVVSLTDGCFPTYGPMGGGGVWANFGLSMLFRVSGHVRVDVIVISNNGQLLDIAQITSLGCDPVHKKVIAVKSKQHFRACLADIAGEIVTVDGGGLGSVILSKGEYEHVRRPIWPLDNITSLE